MIKRKRKLNKAQIVNKPGRYAFYVCGSSLRVVDLYGNVRVGAMFTNHHGATLHELNKWWDNDIVDRFLCEPLRHEFTRVVC